MSPYMSFVLDPFESAKFSIRRAKHHTSNFEACIKTVFTQKEAYTHVVERDPQTGETVQKLKLVHPMPESLQGDALDAVSNLRNALDQAVFATCGLTDSYFPISGKLEYLENAIKGRLEGKVPPEIISIIRAFKPYRGGNDLLWALNQASGKKHGIIAPMVMRSLGWSADSIAVENSVNVTIGHNTPLHFAKNEIELFRGSPETKFTLKKGLTVSFFIGIHGIEVIDSQPAGIILQRFASVVEGIVMAIESEAIRIGVV
jgi:hypothetical protein